MQEFIPGQRWINDAQLQLGLGTVLSTDFRTVTVIYLSTGETNVYAKQSAPLTRVSFAPGDRITTHDDQEVVVKSIREEDGMLIYTGVDSNGQSTEVPEALLSNFIQLNRPAERLFNGQIDKEKWFDLRHQTLLQINRLSHFDLRGLTGCRTSLIPHQIYIAHEVANRYAPRVLLADEVGLGKTIEAGMIIHHQLLTERAKRVLIVVPESLVHQWLVEMLRRFNLLFHIFDEKRCASDDIKDVKALLASFMDDDESEGEKEPAEEKPKFDNVFHSEQLVLCSLEYLAQNPIQNKQCLEGDWDLLIVDEAHHLEWSEDAPSEEYQLIENLAANTKGVLLLTATPEQLGKSSHFARLRLLDPDRFPDYQTFLAEEESYEPIALAIEALMDDSNNNGSIVLDDTVTATLENTLGEGDNAAHLDTLLSADSSNDEKEQARLSLIEHLLDRHGTGRVLFRNTRSAIQGFPERMAIPHPLPLPEVYQTCLERFEDSGETDLQLLLSPERLYMKMSTGDSDEWTTFDPRIDWVNQFLPTIGFEKTLIIAANATTAMDIAIAIRVKTGMHTTVFHEDMSLVERDKAAAWFADMEDGCQVLVCSEIGSEGRNFQFAHHLVLFDLPLNPDLLEQRIGRLDRIGQTETIHLHVPFMLESAQERLFQWYHVGLNAFELTCPAGGAVYKQVKDTLHNHLLSPDWDMVELLEDTQQRYNTINEALHNGRDKLLEYNSCRPHIANALTDEAEEEDDRTDLILYMESIYECFNINSEIHSDNSDIIRPGRHTMASIPGLSEEGMTVTFDRDAALSNEDMQFLTWEHPFVVNAMDMVSTSEHGNTAFTAIKHPDFAAGTVLIEALYLLQTPNDMKLHNKRYLPTTAIRVVLDENGRDHSEHLQENILKSVQHYVDKKTAVKIVKLKEDALRDTLKHCDDAANERVPEILKASHAAAKATLRKEVDRLHALREVNPTIRDEEIEHFEMMHTSIDRLLDETKPRLDALRVIVTM